MSAELKACSKCGALKRRSHFYAAKGGRDGLRASCKQCDVARVMRYQARHPAEKKQHNANYRRSHRQMLREKEGARYQSLSGDEKLRRVQIGYRWRTGNPDKTLRMEIKRNTAMRAGVPYAVIPDNFVEAKVAQIQVTRLCRQLKRGRP